MKPDELLVLLLVLFLLSEEERTFLLFRLLIGQQSLPRPRKGSFDEKTDPPCHGGLPHLPNITEM